MLLPALRVSPWLPAVVASTVLDKEMEAPAEGPLVVLKVRGITRVMAGAMAMAPLCVVMLLAVTEIPLVTLNPERAERASYNTKAHRTGSSGCQGQAFSIGAQSINIIQTNASAGSNGATICRIKNSGGVSDNNRLREGNGRTVRVDVA